MHNVGLLLKHNVFKIHIVVIHVNTCISIKINDDAHTLTRCSNPLISTEFRANSHISQELNFHT